MENLEFSSSLDMIVSEGSGFRPLKTIDSQDLPCDGFGYLSIDYLEKGNVGAFPNKKSWAKYINSVDYYGGSYIITKMIGKKLKGDYGCFCQIERDSIRDEACTFRFNRPIKMVVGGHRSADGTWQEIIEEIDYLRGDVTYEWLFSSNEPKATAIETYLHIKDYGKTGGAKC